MTEAEFDRLVERAIVAFLAEGIVARLLARQRKLLAVFGETTIGLDGAAAAVRALREAGWTVRAIASPAGCRLIAEAGHGDLGVGPVTRSNVEALARDCRAVVVATLTIDAAAKLACAIRDDLVSGLVARALERGLPVIAAVDGACPHNPERARRGFRVAPAYRDRLSANLEALKSYGIRLARSERLAGAVRRWLDSEAEERSAVAEPKSGAGMPEPMVATTSPARVFGRSDALMHRGGELRLDRGVLVTPAAADELAKRDIRLVRT